ncbi:MAG TPA: 6-bladed beta-propeller [Azospirillum sp.]|nr:6-bladed beta-propeller [Azospirillum sp.]
MRRVLAAAALTLALAGCAAPGVAPVLDPGAAARIWPSPPEKARYAYAATLVGEKDFEGKGGGSRAAALRVAEFITGALFGQAAPVELQRPVTGIVDPAGRVLVVDMGQQAVMVFDMPAKRLLRWAHASAERDFSAPSGIALDGKGGYYVTDTDLGMVVHLDGEGRPIGGFGRQELTRPTGIARDPRSGRVYVADTARHKVLMFGPDGRLIDTIGARGHGSYEFNFPTHLTVAGDRLYVADTLNFRIQVFTLEGDGRLAFGQIGLQVGSMTRPKGVAVGGDGRVYVVESYFDHLLVFDPDGRFLLPIGGTGTDEGRFYLPAGVWTDAEGRVYVADMFNGRVSVFKELTRGTD